MWVSMLKGRQRQPSESIASYGDELSRLARKAYADLDYVAQERMALDQLYSAVSPELRLKCIERDCHTVDHAVAIIQTYEGVMGMTSSEESRKSRVRMVDTDNRYTRTETGEALTSDPDTCSLLKRLAARVEQLEKQKPMHKQQRSYNKYQHYNKSNRSKECYGCGAMDHLIRDCPHKRATYPSNNQSFRAGDIHQQNQENPNPSML